MKQQCRYKFPLLILALMLTASCVRQEEAPQGSMSPGSESRALKVAPDTHADLKAVNSLYVARPILALGVRAPELSESLNAAASEELSLHVDYANDSTGKKATNAKDRISRAALIDAARAAKSEAVLVTTISTYRERVGSDVAVSSPAQVGFTMEVVGVSSGATLWSASYHYADQALSDNLLRTREKLLSPGGVRWRTASAVIGAGFRQSLRAFANARATQFSSPEPY